jgi:hypothetical protein
MRDVERQHFLASRLTYGGEVSLARRPLFTPLPPGDSDFCQRLSHTQGHISAGRIR